MATLYDILGVEHDATADQVAQAFDTHRLLHQDASTLTEQDSLKWMAIKEAHAVLSTPKRRHAYDMSLASASQPVWNGEPAAPPRSWLGPSLILVTLILGLLYLFKAQSDQTRLDRAAIEASRVQAEASRANADENKARANAESARFQAELARTQLEREKVLANDKADKAEKAEKAASKTVAERETAKRRSDMVFRTPVAMSQSELLTKVSINSFKVVRIEPESFDIDVDYNCDPSALPITIYAWAADSRSSVANLEAGQNMHIQLSIYRPYNPASTITRSLNMTLSRMSSMPFLRKVYPWTHTWPEIRRE